MQVQLFRVRPGLTPIVSIVLLLMMVVALTGATFTWMTQIQGKAQDEFGNQLQDSISARSISCDVRNGTSDQIHMSLRNTGDTQIDASSVDVYVFDRNHSLQMIITEDWSGKQFTDPGDFDDATVNTTNPLTLDEFYTVEVDFPRANEQVRIGGCIAE